MVPLPTPTSATVAAGALVVEHRLLDGPLRVPIDAVAWVATVDPEVARDDRVLAHEVQLLDLAAGDPTIALGLRTPQRIGGVHGSAVPVRGPEAVAGLEPDEVEFDVVHLRLKPEAVRALLADLAGAGVPTWTSPVEALVEQHGVVPPTVVAANRRSQRWRVLGLVAWGALAMVGGFLRVVGGTSQDAPGDALATLLTCSVLVVIAIALALLLPGPVVRAVTARTSLLLFVAFSVTFVSAGLSLFVFALFEEAGSYQWTVPAVGGLLLGFILAIGEVTLVFRLRVEARQVRSGS